MAFGGRASLETSAISFATDEDAGAPSGDAAANILSHLIVHGGYSLAQLSAGVGLPGLVVEECVRNGSSAARLRSQLLCWLQEDSGIHSAVPAPLRGALREHCGRDHALITSSATPAAEELHSSYAALDPISQRHFRQLRERVGQGYLSVLNQPEEAGDGRMEGWGGWLGGVLYDAFDSRESATLPPDTAMARLQQQRRGAEDSSEALLSTFPADAQHGLAEYVAAVSGAYHANRLEERPTDLILASPSSCTAVEPAFPTDVPPDYWEPSFDLRTLIAQLPMSSSVVAEPSASAADAATTTTTTTTTNTSSSSQSTAGTSAVPHVVVSASSQAAALASLEESCVSLRGWQSEVERSLLQQVQQRSEAFFATSRDFDVLNGEARAALGMAQGLREGPLAEASRFVGALLQLGCQQRRCHNYAALTTLLELIDEVVGDVVRLENWCALPERDMAELPAMIATLRGLHEREKHLQPQPHHHHHDGEELPRSSFPGLSLHQMHCTRGIPARIAMVQQKLAELVQGELVACLESDDLHRSDMATRTADAYRAAAQLGCVDGAVERVHHHQQLRLWGVAKECVVEYLMSSNALDDAAADALFTTVASASPDVRPTREMQKALLHHLAACSALQCVEVLRQLADALATYITSACQRWGFFLHHSTSSSFTRNTSSSSSDAHFDGLRRGTTTVLGLVHEAEALVALVVDVCTDRGPHQMSRVELQQVVRVARSSAMMLHEPLTALAQSVPPQLVPAVQAVHPSKAVRLAIAQLALSFLRAYHAKCVNALTMMIGSDVWECRTSIDVSSQRILQHLCATPDAAAVARFARMSLEHNTSSSIATTSSPSSYATVSEEEEEEARYGPHTAPRVGAAEEELHLPKSDKLYITLDGVAEEGRATTAPVLVLMEFLAEYDLLLARFPSLGFDISNKMCELIHVFDGNSAAMVLGGKAVAQGGQLHRITAAVLCVASQCFATVAELSTRVRERLVVLLSVERGGEGEGAGGGGGAAHASSPPSTAPRTNHKLIQLMAQDWERGIDTCEQHRLECFSKMRAMVMLKVNAMPTPTNTAAEWERSGKEWVLAMLMEVARLLRTVQPLLPTRDVRGVMAPLIGTIAQRLAGATRGLITANLVDRDGLATPVHVFQMNVEKFGFDVLRCALVRSPSDAMREGIDLSPHATEEDVLQWCCAVAAPTASATKPNTTTTTASVVAGQSKPREAAGATAAAPSPPRVRGTVRK